MHVKRAGEIDYTMPSLREGEEVLSLTMSVCPYCYRALPAIIFERSGKVYIRRVCSEHG
ncbi:MAG: radical SAM protein, partial [Desulfurococcaceae archaeon]